MVERGSGVPVVLIPGIQGRWEWLSPAVDALARHCRVITFSLADEPTSGATPVGPPGMEAYVIQVTDVLDRAQVSQAVIVGMSYSGLVATEFANRYPERVLGLVLLSALPPGWTPDARARFYMRAPRLLSPIFALTSPLRLLPEVRAALPAGALMRFAVAFAYRALRSPLSPGRMARRLRWTESFALSQPLRLQAPALVITGEDSLDRVVAPHVTREYLQLIPHARVAKLPRTGHIGLVTRPAAFAELIAGFVETLSSHGKRISA
jgi:pimeloyl-ACP methyl ester carboxylesterase